MFCQGVVCGHRSSGMSLPQSEQSAAADSQRCPCPSVGHPWPQSLWDIFAWHESFMATVISLSHCGSPTATVFHDYPCPSGLECPQQGACSLSCLHIPFWSKYEQGHCVCLWIAEVEHLMPFYSIGCRSGLSSPWLAPCGSCLLQFLSVFFTFVHYKHYKCVVVYLQPATQPHRASHSLLRGGMRERIRK